MPGKSSELLERVCSDLDGVKNSSNYCRGFTSLSSGGVCRQFSRSRKPVVVFERAWNAIILFWGGEQRGS